ncbi:MAG: dihydrofolate reductase family protein [Acidimicrobiia bacterium]|nr:dihydrofolate reductase family protein [Acidimicrobiia bacterium]
MLRNLETGDPVEMLDALFAESRVAEGRPWVMLNMVESIDGATAVGGGATGLNDADDRALFLALRSVADVVMMGAQTVRSEGLGPVRMSEEMMAHRTNAGIEGEPTMVILTRSLDIEPGHRVFSDPARAPVILTSVDADPEKAAALGEVADVRQVESLDGNGIVGALGKASVILCEGGPTLNSHLVAAGVVDEIDLTISPMLAMGESKRIASGPVLDPPQEMALDRAWAGDRSLFLRYVRP